MNDSREPWLRGPLPHVDAALAAAIYALQQTREDLAKHTAGLSTAQVWAQPHGLTPLGFQLLRKTRKKGRPAPL